MIKKIQVHLSSFGSAMSSEMEGLYNKVSSPEN